MWKRILVPLDGSECAQSAFDCALDLAAREPESQVRVCTVVDPHQLTGMYPEADTAFAAWFSPVRKDAELILAAALEKAAKKGVECESTEVFVGPPGYAIASLAEKINADVIVMGTHGRSAFARSVLGSVAEKVTRLAPCAVVTIRPARRLTPV